jgi:hypothetical protein
LARAFPTSLNVIPSADHMTRGTVRVEVELDVAASPLGEDPLWQLYTQVGVTDRLEVGFDWWDVNQDSQWQANAKYQVVRESDRRPAVSVGLFDITRGELANPYVVASKEAGSFRLHAGALHDDTLRGMLGAEVYLSDDSELIADWTTGPWAYATLGYYRELADEVGALLYGGLCNTRAEDDFVGLNVYWEGPW